MSKAPKAKKAALHYQPYQAVGVRSVYRSSLARKSY
jgi:hypothetical protein